MQQQATRSGHLRGFAAASMSVKWVCVRARVCVCVSCVDQ